MVAAALAAGQGEERIDELSLLLAGVDGLLAGGPERAEGDGGAGQGYLEEGLAQHERGPQFVRGVGDEAPLGAEGRFEAGEEPVDGVAEALQLVVGAGEREALVQVALGDLTGGGGHDPERSEDSARDEPAEQHGHADHGDQDDARADEELAGVEDYVPRKGHRSVAEYVAGAGPLRRPRQPSGGRSPVSRSPKDLDLMGHVRRALDQDDQDVRHDDEHDARGEEQTAVERSQAKACAPPAQVGAEGRVAEPSEPRHGSACDPVAGLGHRLDDWRVAELGPEAADGGPDRLAEGVGCLVPDALEDLLGGHHDAGRGQE